MRGTQQHGSAVIRSDTEMIRFRQDADAAIYCFDEAGIGSGINIMRFIYAGKPVFGFYCGLAGTRRFNMTNILQLRLEFPQQVRLAAYQTPDDITTHLGTWLPALRQPAS